MLALLSLLAVVGFYLGLTIRPEWLVDIAENTHLAVNHFLNGANPYQEFAQVFVTADDFKQAENATVVGGQVALLGRPYYFGYPYFPVMFYAYSPFVYAFESFNAIRIANACFFIMQLGLSAALVKSFCVKPALQKKAVAMVLLLQLGVLMFSVELFYYAMTDIVIAVLLLACFLSLRHKKIILAAVFLGLAQSTKLLPAPFIACFLLLFYWRQPFILRAVLAYFATVFVVVAPYIYQNSDAFLSSTILFYLSFHQQGDNSSLWFFLSEAIRPWFLYSGLLLAFASVFWFYCLSKKLPANMLSDKQEFQLNLLLVIASSAVFYMLFMAFNKMTHLNYLWSVYPMLCVAYSVVSFSAIDSSD